MNSDMNADLKLRGDNSSIKTPGDWLENFYGSLFLPQATFIRLRSQPDPIAAALVVVVVNILESLRSNPNLWAAPFSAIIGLGGWLILTLILHRLISIFQKQESVAIATLLTLTGYASSPWIFIAPAQSLGTSWSFLLSVAVLVWFAVWQIWAAAIALTISPWRLFLLIPFSISGGIVAIILLANVAKLLIGFSN
jgi:hypothetical protein